MGQLSHDPSIRHFSHPHPLDLANHHGGAGAGHPYNPLIPQPLCAGCTLPPHGYMYACKTCNYSYTLHVSCAELPPLITHPGHPKHHLTLLKSPAYGGSSFNCDACGKTGAAFCYHCKECDFDIHTNCATKALAVAHRLHHHHLSLEFFPPYPARRFSCDICRNAGSNHWLYRCASCEFDAHLDCATAAGQTSKPSPQPQQRPQQAKQHIQHQVSYPGPYLPPQNQPLQHQNSAPAAVNYNMRYQNVPPQPYMPAVAPRYTQQPYNRMQVQMAPAYVQPQMAPAYGQQQPTVMDTMVQNFIGGAAQQAGQIAVQDIMGGGGANPTAANAYSGGGGADSTAVDAYSGGGGVDSTSADAGSGGGGDFYTTEECGGGDSYAADEYCGDDSYTMEDC